ncbi:MAG: hypothetical protein KAJ32_07215 [Gammaproteobacteria bacterium]|nr:hypothetical protein [Gammaproteobacteria bacterium]
MAAYAYTLELITTLLKVYFIKMFNQFNDYPVDDEFTFQEKVFFLRTQNLPYFIGKVYSPLRNANLLLRGKDKGLNELKIIEYKSAFGQLYTFLLDLSEIIIKKYGKRSQEYENIHALLSNVIKVNQQLQAITCVDAAKESFFRRKDKGYMIPAAIIKNNIMRTIKLYRTVLMILGP